MIVVAEPGDPHPGEVHAGNPEEQLDSAYAYAYDCYRTRKNLFHKNVLRFLGLCWPETGFEELMRRTWITESVLCSAAVEGGHVPVKTARECRARYLEAELALLPSAMVVALGRKAQERMRGIPGIVGAFSAAPPGCNHPRTLESWLKVARHVQNGTASAPPPDGWCRR